MLLCSIYKSRYRLHGPNAIEYSQKIYFDHNSQKCIKFDIEPIKCSSTTSFIWKLKKKINQNDYFK